MIYHLNMNIKIRQYIYLNELMSSIISKDSIQRLLKDVRQIIKHPLTDNNIFYDSNTNLPVIIIQENQLSFESAPTNITGTAINLKNIGWEPLISIENILDEIYFKE